MKPHTSEARARHVWLACGLALFPGGASLGAPPAADASDSLEEVVVSARKRDEKARDVPISLSQVSGDDLRLRGLVRVQDMVRAMPNLSTDIQTPRQASFSIRGLGRNPANDALESSVGVFLDGVYLGRTGMVVGGLVDLERFEVLRGPQGALFGKNATAGVLNILSARPTAVPEGWLEISAGERDLRELRGAASGPIGTSRFSWRLSGYGSQRTGYIHDTARDEWLGELDRAGARAQLQWQPTDTATFRLITDYGSQDEAGPGYLLVDPNAWRLDGSARSTDLVSRAAPMGYRPRFAPDERRNDADAEQRVASENAGATLLADWNVGARRFSSITAWRKLTFRPANDGDFSALDVLPKLGTNVAAEQFSEELRLASPSEGKFQYLAGLQLFEQRVDSNVFAEYGADASGYLFPGLAAEALDGYRVLTDADPETHSYSAFAQTYWWPHEQVEIGVGIRWTTENKSTTVEQHTEGGVLLAPGDAAARTARQRLGSARSYHIESDEDFVSGSISATWHVNQNLNTYLSAARGAKSGGVNAAILPPGAEQVVDPEIALGYETGLKTEWLEGRLQVNASAFLTTIEGYQASIRDRVIGASYLANAGEVRSSGFEAEANYLPGAGLTLSAGVGYNDARYESFHDAACPPELDNQPSCDFTGRRVTGSPPLTVSAAVEHAFALGAGSLQLRSRLEYSHADGYAGEPSRSAWIGPLDLVNLRASLRNQKGTRSLTVWAFNLFDEQYYSGMVAQGVAGTGVTLGVAGAPRSVGLSLEMRY